MKDILSLIKSSFHDVRCCDETSVTTGWRSRSSSITCVLDANGKKTGYAHVGVLEEYDLTTNSPTGNSKTNAPTGGNYIADYPSAACVKDSEPSPPSEGIISINMHSLGKGQFYVITPGGGTINRSISNGYSASVPVPAAVYSVRIVTYAPTPSNLVPCDVVIGNTVYQSPGDITIPNLPSPFGVFTWPVGEGQNHLLVEVQ